MANRSSLVAPVLQKNGGKYFVFVINAEGKTIAIDLGLVLPQGKYQVMMRDENGWNRTSIGRKDKLSCKKLKRFRVEMPKKKDNGILPS